MATNVPWGIKRNFYFVVLTVCLTAGWSQAEQSELVFSEDFEQNPTSRWSFVCSEVSNAKGEWSQSDGHEGTGCLTGHNPSLHWASWVCRQKFPAKPGQRYRVLCWMKSKPGSGGVRYHVTALNNFRGPPNTSADWQRNEWVYTVPEGQNALSVSLVVHGGGSSAWFDDLRIERLERPGVWLRVDFPDPRNFDAGTVPVIPISLENPVDAERRIGLDVHVRNFRGDVAAVSTASVPLAPRGKASHTVEFNELRGLQGWFSLRLDLKEEDEQLSTFWEDFTIFDEKSGLDVEHDPTSVVAANLMPHNSFRDNFTEPGDPDHVEHVTNEIQRLRALGVNYLRLWTRLEKKEDGQFKPRPDLDLMCPVAAKHGMQMTMVLGPGAAAGGICGANFNDQDLDEYTRWVEWSVGRYGKWVRTYEIANEVLSYPAYLNALRAAHLAAKRVDSDIRVLHSAAYWYHWQKPTEADTYLYGGTFWPHLLAFGWPYSDGLNIHEYGVPQVYLPAFLRRYQNVCNTHTTGTYAESIWQTECGSECGVSRPHGVPYPPGLNPPDHAAAASHQYLITKAAGGPDTDHKAFWYLPTDGWGRPIGGWWATGFYDPTRSAKSAAIAAKTTATHLRDATFIGELSTTGRDHVMVFRKGGKPVVAAWASTKTYEATPKTHMGAVGIVGAVSADGVVVTLPTDQQVTLHDLMGNAKAVDCPNGDLKITLDQFPVFVYGLRSDVLFRAAQKSIADAADDAGELAARANINSLHDPLVEVRELALAEFGKGPAASRDRLAQIERSVDGLSGKVLAAVKAGKADPRASLACLNVWRLADILKEVDIFVAHRAGGEGPNVDLSSARQMLDQAKARLSVDRHAPKTAALLRLAERRLYQAGRAVAQGDKIEAHHRQQQARETVSRAELVLAVEPAYRLSTWIQPTKHLWIGDDLQLEFQVHNESDEQVNGRLRVKEQPVGWAMTLPSAFTVKPKSVLPLAVRARLVTGSRRTDDLVVDAELGEGMFTVSIGVGLRGIPDRSAKPRQPNQPVTWRVPWWTGEDGNPYVDPAGATWNVCQLMPGKDPRELSSYQPMAWDATTECWFGPNAKHGHPTFRGETPVLSCSYLNDGHRDPALIFTAPADGRYTVSGAVGISEYPREVEMKRPLLIESGVWQPDGTGYRALRRTELTRRGPLEIGTKELEGIFLRQGQKLLLCRFQIGNMYRYASYNVGSVLVHFQPGAAPTGSTAGGVADALAHGGQPRY
ncbi:MAG: DUF4398 domain-containing protein [Planctomycetes bacterium]|nr:DUF4398 domain-containing protein [Planctomycetota bacterium]